MKRNFGFSLIAAYAGLFLLLAVNPVSALPLAGDSEIQISGGASHSQGSNTGSCAVAARGSAVACWMLS